MTDFQSPTDAAELTLSQRVERAVHLSLEQAGHFRGRRSTPVHPDTVRNAIVAAFDAARGELGLAECAELFRSGGKVRACIITGPHRKHEDDEGAVWYSTPAPAVPVVPTHIRPFEVWMGTPDGGAVRLDDGDDANLMRAVPAPGDRASARNAARLAAFRVARVLR